MTPADATAAAPPSGWSQSRGLELVAVVVLFAWIALAPVVPFWMHTATALFSWPLAVLLVAAAALLGSRLLAARAGRAAGRTAPVPLFDHADWPLVALLLALLASAGGRELPAVSWRLGSQLAIVLASTYVIGKALGRSPHFVDHLRAVALPLGLAVAVYGLYETCTGSNPLCERLGNQPYYEQYREAGRPIATQANPAPLGTWLLVNMVLCGGAALARGGRNLAILVALTLGPCLVLTRSRGAFLGGVAGLLVVLATSRVQPGRRLHRWRLVALGVAAAALGVAIAQLLPPPWDQFGCYRLFGEGGLLGQDRMIRQQAALAMWRAQPWLGVGFDHYPWRFAEYAGTDPMIAHFAGTPDNTWLTLLAENGLLGAGAFAVLAGSLVARGLRAQARAVAPTMLRAATAALVALLVNCVGYSALYWLSPCMLFGVTAGIVGGLADARSSGAQPGTVHLTSGAPSP